jgi:scyllo-inositol 2-dehydrogenase (NADP+)
MRTLVVGLGTQGNKRVKYIQKELVGTVDPFNENATYSDISQAPIESYDSVFLCVPDSEKIALIKRCISNGKHILVEKPLSSDNEIDLTELQASSIDSKVFIYTAYNHRFEPHFVNIKNHIEKKEIGKLYSIRMFYGNGTSQLVKSSYWRDKGMGVISDLAPHLLDTLAFWFGVIKLNDVSLIHHNFETLSPDHAIIHFNINDVAVELEMSLCMWKNTFTCDIVGEKGSLHMSSLCKWGPSTLSYRERVLPTGIPKERTFKIEKQDPTWEQEHQHFFNQIYNKNSTDLSTDIWISRNLNEFETLM